MNTDNKRKDDGGPAFPLQDWDDAIKSKRFETGMTLRDYFAGQALIGLAPLSMDGLPLEEGEDHAGFVAGSCYEFADAMLERRKQ